MLGWGLRKRWLVSWVLYFYGRVDVRLGVRHCSNVARRSWPWISFNHISVEWVVV